jgi:hypothetical protein
MTWRQLRIRSHQNARRKAIFAVSCTTESAAQGQSDPASVAIITVLLVTRRIQSRRIVGDRSAGAQCLVGAPRLWRCLGERGM